MQRWLGYLLLAFLVPGHAHAQGSAVYQNGTAIANHIAKFVTNGRIADSGGINGDENGFGVAPFSIYDKSGIGLCSDTKSTLDPATHRFCLGHTSTGDALLSVTGGSFTLEVNGVAIPAPGSVSGLPTVADNVALTAQPSTFASVILRQDHTIGLGGPAVFYRSSTTACSIPGGDGGSQVPSQDGKCWIALFEGMQPTFKTWGAKGDGTTDDTAPIQAALTAMARKTIYQGSASYYVANTITVPSGTTVKGQGNVGAPNYHNAFFDFTQTPAIRLKSTATIQTQSGVTLDGLLIYRAGMSFPSADSSAFAGTAITTLSDSIALKNGMILGFNMGMQTGTGGGHDKGLVENMNFDNQSNLNIPGSADTWRIHHVHAWPWVTFQGAISVPDTALYRTGTNLQISGSNDAAVISDYLAFGYATSFSFVNDQGVICQNCDADGPNLQPNVVGFSITGTNGQAHLINPSIYGRAIGILIDHTGGESGTVTIQGGTFAGIQNFGIRVLGTSAGQTFINGITMGSVNFAMEIASANELVTINNSYIGSALDTVPIHVTVPSSKVFLGNDNVFGDPVANAGRTIITGSVSSPVAPSGSSLSLPPVGGVFTVSGTSTFAFVNGQWAGRVVTLVFQGAATVQSTTGGAFGSVQLNGSVNYVGSAGSTLTLACNDPSKGWVEVGRMKP